MRFKTIVASAFMMSSLALAAGSSAQRAPDNPLAPPLPAQSDHGQRSAPVGTDMMPPQMMEMMRGMSQRGLEARERDRRAGGPLQMVSRLLRDLDDPRVRSTLGLSDQQADSLRKIIIDTETFTIKTGANIAVDSIDLRELLREDKPDKSVVKAKGDEISKYASELINHYLDAILAAKALLTPEQQKMIRAYIERGAPALPAPPPRP